VFVSYFLFDKKIVLDNLQKEIGEGGNGVVWIGENINDKKKVVVKKIGNIDNLNVKREIELANKIGSNHGNSAIIQFYDTFCENNNHYIVMEYCENGSLLNYINSLKQQQQILKEDVFFFFIIIFNFVFFCCICRILFQLYYR
jgi:serine/threonine protein kinase